MHALSPVHAFAPAVSSAWKPLPPALVPFVCPELTCPALPPSPTSCSLRHLSTRSPCVARRWHFVCCISLFPCHLDQCFSNVSMPINLSESLSKCRFDPAGVGWGPSVCVSNQFPDTLLPLFPGCILNNKNLVSPERAVTCTQFILVSLVLC